MRRRDVLKGGAGAAVLAGCRPEGADSASPPATIEHVIVVMMENRSFDHYLGALKALEGREDVDGLTGDESNPDADGAPVKVYPMDKMCQQDPPHGWDSGRRQFSEGTNQGFVQEHTRRVGDPAVGAEVMGFYDRETLPIHYALADAFALPDAFFCSVMGPTWPNRLYGQSGTSNGYTSNDPEPSGFSMKTVYKALEEVGLGWSYYYTDVPFIGLFRDHWDTERIDLVDKLFTRLEQGKLEAFTWVDPGFAWNDDHPPHHVQLGQLFLATLVEALVRSPAWEKTLLVITYDEHGGFYDHVPPPEMDDDRAGEGFEQLGFRVPALVISPWVKKGVHHTVFDNTSVLKYVCERFGLEPWTRRIAATASLGELLDSDRMARNEPLEAPLLPTLQEPEIDGEACAYDTSSISATPDIVSNQEELERWVRENMPSTLRLDPKGQSRALVERARKLGLLRG